MKIIIDDKVILDITDTMLKVLLNDILEHELRDDIERRLKYIILHKYQACFDRLKDEWDKKLSDRDIEMIPTNQEKYAELVFEQPDYKSRTKRES